MSKLFRGFGMIMTILLCLSISSVSYARDTQKEHKIRVGFYQMTGFQNIGEDGKLSGYGFDYLQAMAQYNNWQLEFITGYTWSECLEMLERGELDLLGGMLKTPEREASFDFPQTWSGMGYTCLVVSADNPDIGFEDYASFNNMTVGLAKSNARNEGFMQYCNEKKFKVRTVMYDNQELLYDAVNKGEVDAMLITSSQQVDEYRIVSKFDPLPQYFATTKGNAQVVEALNYALIRIKTYSPNFDEALYAKHYSRKKGQSVVFSEEEKQYIAQNPNLTILLDTERKPIEGVDLEEEKPHGIAVDVMERIADIAGFTLDYKTFEKREEKFAPSVEGETDILMAITYDYTWANEQNLHITQPFIEIPFVTMYIERKTTDSVHRIALPRGFYITQILENVHIEEDVQFLYYDSTAKCVEAVYNNEADYTFANSYEANYYMSLPKYRKLQYRNLQNITQPMSIAVAANADPLLYEIVSKTLHGISEETLREIVRVHTSEEQQTSFIDLVYTNPVEFLVIIVGVLAMLFLLLVLVILYSNNKKKNIVLEKAYSAKGEFLSRISHDMRTPMNAVISFSTLALDEKADRVTLLSYMNKIQSAGKYLLELINDVLDMSKIEKHKLELNLVTIKMNELFQGVLSTVHYMMEEKNITFLYEVRHFEADSAVIIDKVRIQQILMNLLSNAMKFTPENGTVECFIEKGKTQDNTGIRLIVRDNGSGMSENFQKIMFLPFEQEKERMDIEENGTGLGLSIVKNLVDLMNGTILVNSQLGVGTEIIIEIEVRQAKPEQEKEKKRLVMDFAGIRVLLCEDHPINKEIATKILEKKGIAVECAENGKLGLEKFIESEVGYYDAVLMDIRMPVMDGLTATQKMRELDREDAKLIPIIAMTANAFEEDVQRSIAAGMNAHLAKPIDPHKLFETLRIYLR